VSFILSKDAAIYYEEHGSGEPLILLPGLLGTIESTWRRFVPEFSKHFHTIAVDLRNHGKTNNPSGAFDLGTLLHDMHTLFETLQIERAHMCGYSLGGYLGLLYGLHHREKCITLVMHGTKFFWDEEAASTMTGRLSPDSILARQPGWADALQKDHAPGNGEKGWTTLLRRSADLLHRLPAEGIAPEALHQADFPVLVSVGEDDEIIPHQEAKQLAGILRNGRLVVLNNTRHPMQTVHKQTFLDAVLPFLGVPSGSLSC
jgi:pimeloyl-ACP methyl ester carboxylesterase